MLIDIDGSMMKQKTLAFYIWLITITIGISTYLFFPEEVNVDFLKGLSEVHYITALVIYLLILSTRGLTMIPSTPLLFAGILIFDPVVLFITNMMGILISSTLVYYFSRYLGLDTYFENKYRAHIQKIKTKMDDKELLVIIGWSFFPLVPTDLIVYVGSTLRINVFKCLVGVFVGESVLNTFYIVSATLLLRP